MVSTSEQMGVGVVVVLLRSSKADTRRMEWEKARSRESQPLRPRCPTLLGKRRVCELLPATRSQRAGSPSGEGVLENRVSNKQSSSSHSY